MLIAVTSTETGAGKTGVAAAIARHFGYAGKPTRLVRTVSEGPAASADAAYFGSLFFAPGSSTAPATDLPADDAATVTVVECTVEQAKALAAAGAKVVLVAKTKAAAVKDLSPAATIVTRGPAAAGVINLADDRTLNGFSLSEAMALTNAELIVEGDKGDPTCDYLVIAPIGSDAGQPYFRRFRAMAVVVRFDKTDMHLAALAADPECLILTGGRRPSDYLFDAASARGVPVLLSRTDTENTVIALETVFDNTRFRGERKLDRISELLAPTGLFATLEA